MTRRAGAQAEERLLVSLIRLDTGVGDDAEAIAGLLERVDHARFRGLLEAHQLMPLAGRSLLQSAGSLVPSALAAEIGRRTAAWREIGSVQAMLGDSVLRNLTDAGIAAAWLKGPHLSELAHRDVGMRISGDVDVLVPPGRLEAAVSVVTEMGWTPTEEWTDRTGRPRLHYSMRHPAGLPPVEIHWRVHWYEREFAERALARGDAGASGVRLRDDDVLALLLLFYARDGLAGLRMAADVLAWRNRFCACDPGLPPACENRALRPALLAAAAAVARVAGRPDDAFLVPPRPRRASAALALADPMLHMKPTQRLADRALVDVLLAPTAELPSALRRQLWPPRIVLRQRRPELRQAGPGRLVMAQIEHAGRTLRRFVLAPVVRLKGATTL